MRSCWSEPCPPRKLAPSHWCHWLAWFQVFSYSWSPHCLSARHSSLSQARFSHRLCNQPVRCTQLSTVSCLGHNAEEKSGRKLPTKSRLIPPATRTITERHERTARGHMLKVHS